jgi:DNA-binding protein HU-beta
VDILAPVGAPRRGGRPAVGSSRGGRRGGPHPLHATDAVLPSIETSETFLGRSATAKHTRRLVDISPRCGVRLMPHKHPPPFLEKLSCFHVARREISTPIGLQVFYVEAQIGLLLIMIRRLSLPRKPAAATRPPAKKTVARTLKAKLQAPVVTLKHLAAEIAEAHEVPKTRAETMLADTVVRLARHLVKGNKVRIVGLGIFQVKRREARMGRNPQTGEAVKIKASKKVTFRAGKELKEAV